MRKTLWIIAVILFVSFCAFPLQIEHLHTDVTQAITVTHDNSDDDALQKTESIAINYARKDKRVKIEKHVRVIERAAAEKAVHFYLTEFNDTGLLTEAIKRDYSGEDPLIIANA